MTRKTGEGRCKTIMIIEDDAEIREALRDALLAEGYSVEVASNGKEGLEIVKSVARPCLILLDLMMPVMNGLEFLELARADDVLITIPVVMVTAYEALARSAKGATAVIKKPIDLEHLLKYVTEFCG